MKKLLLAMMTAMLLAACNKDISFYRYTHTDANGWEKNDHLTFSIDSVQEEGIYSLSLALRMNEEYPFRNLQIVVSQTIFPSNETFSDIVTCRVTNKNGIMLGHGVTIFQYDIPVRKHKYNVGDSIAIQVRHNMKREILPGITDVGILMKKSALYTGNIDKKVDIINNDTIEN